MEIKRDRYLEMLKNRKHNGLVKVITGIRRCGKSYLLNNIFYKYLIESGVKEDHIIKFAFDSDDDLALIGEDRITIEKEKRKVDSKKFGAYIRNLIADEEMYYLLLDEVQLMECFEFVLTGYLYKSNLDVYVTGSNSKFLSKDVITEFAGRGDEIHIFPLSFSEFLPACGEEKSEAFDTYMVYGGLPAVALMPTEEQKASYLRAQMNNVYLRDIISRYNIHSDNDLGELIDMVASGISTMTNPAKLANTFKTVKKSSLSAATISNYIDYMQEAFILNKARRYDVKGKNYINTPFKLYFEDVGLRNARIDFRQIENTHIMENVIYNELRYRGFSVDVGVVEVRERDTLGNHVRKQLEIDFVANMGSKRYYIQSAYDIPDEDKLRQETQSFNKVNDSFKKIIIVEKSMKPRRDEKGYVMMGVKEFLLDPNSLDA